MRFCKLNLVCQDNLIVELSFYSFIKNLSMGGLLYLKESVSHSVTYEYSIGLIIRTLFNPDTPINLISSDILSFFNSLIRTVRKNTLPAI